MNTKKTIFISAGEASGDLLGADLVKALLTQDESLNLLGMCGPRMRQAGAQSIINAEELYVMGFIEIITYFPKIVRIHHQLKNYLQKNKPDLLILIDFSSWHFRVMKIAKKIGIPVLYYVSPKIWASRSNRLDFMTKHVDHMAVLFAFEKQYYHQAGIPSTFVGHPLADIAKPSLSKNEAYAFFNLDPNKKIIALFPGSRGYELKHNLPTMIKSAEIISEKIPTTQFVLFLADHFNANEIQKKLPANIVIRKTKLYDLLNISDAAIAASGTVTLEITLMKTPFCITYKVSALSYWIAKQIVKIPYIGLCNILANKAIVKEFIQKEAIPSSIATEILQILEDATYQATMKKSFSDIMQYVKIPEKNTSTLVSTLALTMLKQETHAK